MKINDLLTEAPFNLDREHNDYPQDVYDDERDMPGFDGGDYDSEEDQFLEKFGDQLDRLGKGNMTYAHTGNVPEDNPDYKRGLKFVHKQADKLLYQLVHHTGRSLMVDDMVKEVWKLLDKLWIKQDTFKSGSPLGAGILAGIDHIDEVEGIDFMLNYSHARN